MPSFLGNLFFVLCLLVSLIMIGMSFVTIECEVTGESMQPTLNTLDGSHHDYVLVNKYDDTYKYGDIVVITSSESKSIIKRIVGLPGDTIDFVYDDYYVRLERNGEVVLEDYLRLRISSLTDACDFDGMFKVFERWMALKESNPEMFVDGKMVLASDEVFVLGDNRWVSLDSSSHGPYKLAQIVGVVDSVKKYNVSEFEFYWDYITRGKFFYTLINLF